MQKEFIPYEQALELKELGFNEPCFGYWKMSYWLIEEKTRTDGYTHADQLCSAPTFSQVFRWFREKYKKVDYPEFDYDEQKWHCHSDYKGYLLFDTYDDAELACLKKLIEIVKNKDNE
jgi:hypothetical protein